MSWTPTDDIREHAEEAAVAAIEGYEDAHPDGLPAFDLGVLLARAVLVAVGPHIAEAERERIARNIEARMLPADTTAAARRLRERAAGIAREGA